MTSSSSTEFTATDGRRFAFPVGTAFLLLAGVLLWRGRATPMWITGGLGLALLAAGVLLPARLGPLYRGWMKMAHAISKITTPVFMAIVYYVIFTPAGWLMRAFGKRPIVHRADAGSFWQRTDRHEKSDLRRQF